MLYDLDDKIDHFEAFHNFNIIYHTVNIIYSATF